MTVEVYCWPPKGTNIGHAAIMVDDGSRDKIYLSVWPGSLLSVIVGPARFNEYIADLSEEGLERLVVRLTKLDEAAIKKQIESCKRGSVYSFPGFNCATQASICLNAGVPYNNVHQALDAISSMGNPLAFVTQTSTINTPWDLFLYAKALATKYA